MNRLIAENRYTLTKELFYEGMDRVTKETLGPTVKKVVLGLAAAWIILAAVSVLLKQNLFFIAFETIVLLMVSLWFTVYLPRHKRMGAYNKLEGQYGSDMDRTTRFYEDELVINAAGRELSFSYADIVKKLSTEHLLILLTADNTGIMIAKNGFTLGSESMIDDLI